MCKSTPPLIATPWVAFTHVIGLNKIPPFAASLGANQSGILPHVL